MTRRGYALATRRTGIDDLIDDLKSGFGPDGEHLIRFHQPGSGDTYQGFERPGWEDVADGVDVIQDPALIRAHFPSFDPEIRSILHVRRAGDISGQQLGMFMLDHLKAAGAQRLIGSVTGIEAGKPYRVEITDETGSRVITADRIVNAAGPEAMKIARMIGVDLPLQNVFQQKIAFEDHAGAIPRAMPFAIDLDPQTLNWSEEEREMLLADEAHAWMARPMPGSTHCRPDGGDQGTWIKLGWAYNRTPSGRRMTPRRWWMCSPMLCCGAPRGSTRRLRNIWGICRAPCTTTVASTP